MSTTLHSSTPELVGAVPNIAEDLPATLGLDASQRYTVEDGPVTEVLGMAPQRINTQLIRITEEHDNGISHLEAGLAAKRALYTVFAESLHADDPSEIPSHLGRTALQLDNIVDKQLLLATHRIEQEPMSDKELAVTHVLDGKEFDQHISHRHTDHVLKEVLEGEEARLSPDQEMLVTGAIQIMAMRSAVHALDGGPIEDDLWKAAEKFAEDHTDYMRHLRV